MEQLTGRTALITGGGRGIGRALAIELAKMGVSVGVMARSHAQVQTVAEEIQAQGGQAIAIAGDVSDYEDVANAVGDTVRAFGSVEMLINNAAIIGPVNQLHQLSPEQWVVTQQINLIGSFYCMHAVLPAMIERGWGRILNITSGAGKGSGILNGGAYSVSKAGLDMLTRSAASEAEGTGVYINAISPGTVDTDMQIEMRNVPIEQASDKTAKMFRAFHDEGQLADPMAVAKPIIALLISEVNGAVTHIRDLPDEAKAILDSL